MTANFQHRLKQCPFCGEFVRIIMHDLEDQCYVECETCQAMGPTGGDIDSAKFQWNSRAGLDNRDRNCLRCGRQLLQEREPGYRMCVTCRKISSGMGPTAPPDYGVESGVNKSNKILGVG